MLNERRVGLLNSDGMITILQQAVLACAIATGLAKAIDFMLGAVGRKRVYDLVVYQSWYKVESFSLEAWLHDAASKFKRVLVAVFGDPDNPSRMRILLLVFVGAMVLDYVYQYRLADVIPTLERSSYHTPNTFLHIGTGLSGISFFVTIGLVDWIERSRRPIVTLLAWMLDLIACAVLIFLAHICAELFWGELSPSIALGPLKLSGFAVSVSPGIIATTILHLLFAAAVGIGYSLEAVRRAVALILDRIDEAGSSPLTIIAALMSGVTSIIVALIAYLKTLAG